jgi:hypothetical protein
MTSFTILSRVSSGSAGQASINRAKVSSVMPGKETAAHFAAPPIT